MIVVIFEVQFVEGQEQHYFELANQLRNELVNTEGFISGERFESVTTPGKFVAISYWRDLEAVQTWRNQHRHRHAQREGHNSIIVDYRLNVASVLRGYTLADRHESPEDSQRYFEKCATLNIVM